jgi:predicted CXXCH cytochrome family protein
MRHARHRELKAATNSDIICLVLFLKIFLASVAAASGGNQTGISIIAPSDSRLVEGDTITFVFRLSDYAPDKISITKNNKNILILPVDKEKDFLCRTITVGLGLNELVVHAVKDTQAMKVGQISIYRRSDISRDFKTAPHGFKKDPFHSDKKEQPCLSCHRLKVTAKELNPGSPDESLCYPCHRKITDYPYIHGPAAVWDCLSCHNKDSLPDKYATVKPDRDLCFVCHVNEKNEWATKKYIHGPTSTGMCTICHNPHASAQAFWLKKPAWDLCTSCHEDKATGKHVTAGYVYGPSHPTKGMRDPLRAGKELSCASCHNPHAANTLNFFAFNAKNGSQLCGKCHNL